MVATASGWVMYGSPELAELPGVRLLGDLVGPLHQLEVGLGVQSAVHREQRFQHGPVRRGGGALPAHPAGEPGPHPPGRRRRRHLRRRFGFRLRGADRGGSGGRAGRRGRIGQCREWPRPADRTGAGPFGHHIGRYDGARRTAVRFRTHGTPLAAARV